MVDPNIWGKHGWKFIHYVAQGYPNNPTSTQKKTYKEFFLKLGEILPCYKCSKNYQSHLQSNPLTMQILENKNNLENWVISIHNQVNQMNQKSILNLHQAKKTIKIDDCKIDKQDNQDKQDNKYIQESNDISYIVIICILIAIILFLFIKNNLN